MGAGAEEHSRKRTLPSYECVDLGILLIIIA